MQRPGLCTLGQGEDRGARLGGARGSVDHDSDGDSEMQRLNLIGVALVVLFALSDFATSSASALPELLPLQATWTGKNDAANPTWETLAKEKIPCTAATAEGTQTSDTLGLFHISFAGCKAAGIFNCNSLGDASGTILTLGQWHSVYDSLSPLGVAILFLPEHLHYECSGFVLVLILGSVLCLVLEPASAKLTHLLHCEQTRGDQSERTWWNDAGVAQTAELRCAKNEGAEESCGLLSLLELTFKEVSSFENV
jgi:hypothetical protein